MLKISGDAEDKRKCDTVEDKWRFKVAEDAWYEGEEFNDFETTILKVIRMISKSLRYNLQKPYFIKIFSDIYITK